MYREDAITAEKASDVTKDLRASNDRSAMVLARNCSQRFFFRFISLRTEFASHRAANPKATTEKDCLLGLILPRLSPWGREVVKRAEGRVKRYENLSNSMFKSRAFNRQLAKLAEPGQFGKLEAEMLRVIISFEVKNNSNDPSWTFSGEGLSQLTNDFSLLNEYIGHHQHDWIEEFCERWTDFVLDAAHKAEIEKLPPDERKPARVAKLMPVLLPLWLFLGAVCRVLHESESPLTAVDAFWLGLIDEVIGDDLPTLRKVVEMGGVDQKPKKAKVSPKP
jgi:hypothetical protein